MAFSLVRLIKSVCVWTCFVVGSLMNVFLVFVIRKHTPKEGEIYSKILLQTCVTDLLLLLASVLTDVALFSTDGGKVMAMWNNGLVPATGPGGLNVGWLLTMIWIFFVYVSLFGFVGQFIYRYLTLCREHFSELYISTTRYFLILFGIFLVPLLYSVVFANGYLPPTEHVYLNDSEVFGILGLESNEPVLLSGYSPAGNPLMNDAFYYILACCWGAFALMIVLAWRMHRFVRTRMHSSNILQKKTLELQKQLTRTLVIQAALAFTILLPDMIVVVTFILPLSFLATIAVPLQYYTMLSIIPMFFPAAVDPLITLLLIRSYRAATKEIVRRHLLRLVDRLSPTGNQTSVNNYNYSSNITSGVAVATIGGGRGMAKYGRRHVLSFSNKRANSNKKVASQNSANRNI